MENIAFITNETLFFACVLGLAAIAGIFAERSGTVNIAIEGTMSMGALGYCIISALLTSGGRITGANIDAPGIEIISLIFAALFGSLFSLLLGLSTIKLKAEHTITGVALNLLSVGICAAIMNPSLLGNAQKQIDHTVRELALSTNYNEFGNILSFKLFFLISVVVISWFALNKTKWGLRFKAVGENPQAVDVAGINVYKYKWMGIVISGCIAGMAGGVFAQKLPFSGQTNGFGFLALAIMIMSHWNVLIVPVCALFFGFFQQIGAWLLGVEFANIVSTETNDRVQKIGELIKAIPYILTLISIMAFSKLSPGPAASGINYDKSKR
ncbi:ABC transporter permease [Mycoplasmopsis bovis]|uniref:ABC transporter permease n=1 Tax=Mycoplasmopsis bovis TaxID=28903 RepID=UPI002106974F|nr:ABC transporter permease [Mycoplasmopsis bovis]UTW26168.1 ABC transporter permease [Mycoplasmopsis bovis]